MNLLSGNLSVRLELSLTSLLSQAVVAVGSGENQRPPLSAHFSIESDESGVDDLSRKQDSAKVKLNCHLIQVVETKICCNRSNAPITAAVFKMETI